jgi:DMSO/TMAO reductase YedYZ molybdopterin-dependent catalytic subunit
MSRAHDGYTTDLPLTQCRHDHVPFAWELDGEPLPREHGGPVRVVAPHRCAHKGAKWVGEVEFLTEPRRGFRKRRGYSGTADPWIEDRYG